MGWTCAERDSTADGHGGGADLRRCVRPRALAVVPGGGPSAKPLIAVLTAGDQALVKEGSLSALWNHEYSEAADVTVAG